MMKFFSRFATSSSALLAYQSAVADAETRTETIRESLLKAIYEIYEARDKQAARVWSKLATAGDIQSLWYLRSDVLQLLSGLHGESVARKKMDDITALFQGLVFESQMPLMRRTNR